MNVLHTTEVTEDQIDHLGHMNVMFYGVHAATGAQVLLDGLGLPGSASASEAATTLVEHDRYTRHHNEQLLGARLEVHGGLVGATPTGVRLYEELVNADTGDLAATFLLGFEGGDPIDSGLVTAGVPDHGRPRSVSIDDDPVADAPGLDVLRERDIAIRQVRTVTDDEAGRGTGASIGLVADLCWGGAPLENRAYQEFHEGPDGIQIGWATMETRATWARRPSAGDRVQSFEAEVEIARKVVHSRHWVYDVDRADLVCAFSTVSLAFDPALRRSVEIPDHVRREFSVRYHPDLG